MVVIIKKAAVLGAGTMGAQIAGHLAGCGIEVLLLDTAGALVLSGIERLKKSKPAAMYDLDDLKFITAGNFQDDLSKISECDMVIEAVVEKLDIKQKLFIEVEKHLRAGTIVSSNTSGILLRQLAEGRSEAFRKNFLITHFFNPVRYMKLVEVVSGRDTDKKNVEFVAGFLEGTLGKGVVYAKDTINFIANRIGVHAVVTAFHAVAENKWPIEVVDQIMGTPTCRPKSAIFRTADIVGLDTLVYVARNGGLKLPAFVEDMVSRGWLGEKSGQGFYKKEEARSKKQEAGKAEILVLDPETMEYRSQQKIKTPSLGKARDITDPVERLRTVVLAEDEAGKIARPLVEESIRYSAEVLNEIADSSAEVDRAMKWGFNWEMGPFEQAEVLRSSKGVSQEFHRSSTGVPQEFRRKKVVATNAGADVVDIGDGVFLCEFHTKMNAIDGDVIAMLNQALDIVEREGSGLVVGNNGANFSVGANLMLVWMASTNGQWGEIDQMVREFQKAGQRMRFCRKPVIAAPFGLALGGGCEISMAAENICAAAETYMGLVEVGVGVIPAGGGCKNFLLRMEERHRSLFNPKNKIWGAPEDGGPFPKARDAFQTIAFARVSTGAKEARKIGYLRPKDGITLDKSKLLLSARDTVLKLANGYGAPKMREDIILPGSGGKMALVNGIRQAYVKGDITEHDAVIGEKLAHVLTGGDRPSIHQTTEQHILDLEREVFLSLCGMEKTQNRIQHMLTTGKPLRN